MAESVLKQLHSWAYPVACASLEWDEQVPNSLPKDPNNVNPKPLKNTNFNDIMRCVFMHQKVCFIGNEKQLDLAQFKDIENVDQQVSFLNIYAEALRERRYFASPQTIDFQIEQIRLMHEISTLKLRDISLKKFVQLARMKLTKSPTPEQKKEIESFIVLLTQYKALLEKKIDVYDENVQQKQTDKFDLQNEMLANILKMHPVPLLKALIPFNIGSYNNFYNLFTRKIPLPVKLNQREGLWILIPKAGEIMVRIPQGIKILSKDKTHEIGSAKFEMVLQSQGDAWKGSMSISEAFIAPSATPEEKIEFVAAFAGASE